MDASERRRWSLRELFECAVFDRHGEPCGERLLRDEFARHGGGRSLAVLEASGAVSSFHFANITGQIVYNEVLERFRAEPTVFASLIPVVPTKQRTEKIAGVAGLGVDDDVVEELGAYPEAKLNEDWIDTAYTRKRGQRLSVSKEAVMADRTGQLLEEAGDVGAMQAVSHEIRAIDCIIDENTTTHRYRWRNTTYATYQSSTPWVNIKSSNALVDHTDIDAAEQVLQAIVNPWNGLPQPYPPKHLIFSRGLLASARRILNATEIREATPGYATSGNPTQSVQENPYRGMYQPLTSNLLAARLATDSTWFLGDISRAFRYMENWPITVESLDATSLYSFERDVVACYKVSQMGAFTTVQPRAMVKNTA
jgi:hypothetical protein